MKKDEKKRSTLSFEPEPQVSELLQKAQTAGLTKGEIINESLKECGVRIVKKLVEKRTKELASLSFEQAEFLFDRLLAA